MPLDYLFQDGEFGCAPFWPSAPNGATVRHRASWQTNGSQVLGPDALSKRAMGAGFVARGQPVSRASGASDSRYRSIRWSLQNRRRPALSSHRLQSAEASSQQAAGWTLGSNARSELRCRPRRCMRVLTLFTPALFPPHNSSYKYLIF